MKGNISYLQEIPFNENLSVFLYTEISNIYANRGSVNSIDIFLDPINPSENDLMESNLLLRKTKTTKINDKPDGIIHRICFSGEDIIYLSEVIHSLQEIDFKIFLHIKVFLNDNKTNIPLIAIVYIINILLYLEPINSGHSIIKFLCEKLLIKSGIEFLAQNKYNFINEFSKPTIKNVFLKQILVGLKSELNLNLFTNSHEIFNGNKLKIFKLNLRTKEFEIFRTNFNLIFTPEIILINCNLNLEGDYLFTFCLTETLQFTYTLFTNFFSEGIFREGNIGTFKFIDFVFTESPKLVDTQVFKRDTLLDFNSLLKYLINWKLKSFSNFKSLLVDFFRVYKQSGLVNGFSDNLLGCLIILFDFEIKRIEEFERGSFKLNDFIVKFKYPFEKISLKETCSLSVSKTKGKYFLNQKTVTKTIEITDDNPVSVNTYQPLIPELKPPLWTGIHFSKLNILPKELCLKNSFEIYLKESKGLPNLPVLKSTIPTNKIQNKLTKYKKLIYGKIKDTSKTIFNERVPPEIYTIIDKNRIRNWLLPISSIAVNEMHYSTKFYEKRILVVSLCAKNLEKQNLTGKNIIQKIIDYFNSERPNNDCIQINELKCLKKMGPEKDELVFLKTCEKFQNLINIMCSDNENPLNEDCLSGVLASSDLIENYIKISYILQPTLNLILFREETVSYMEKLISCLFKYITAYSFLLESDDLKVIVFIIEHICVLINEIQLESVNPEHKENRAPFNITSLNNILEYFGKGNKRILDLLVKSYGNFLKIHFIEFIPTRNTSLTTLKTQIIETFGKNLKVFNEFEVKVCDNKNSLKIFQQNFACFLKAKNVFKEPIHLHVKAFNDFISSFNNIFIYKNERKILKEISNTEKYKIFKKETEKNIEELKKLFEIVFYLQKKVCEYFGLENIEEIMGSIEYLLREVEKEFIKEGY